MTVRATVRTKRKKRQRLMGNMKVTTMHPGYMYSLS